MPAALSCSHRFWLLREEWVTAEVVLGACGPGVFGVDRRDIISPSLLDVPIWGVSVGEV